MATIKLKRGTGTPTTSNISSGEVAVDTSGQKVYINDNGSIKLIGTNFTSADNSASATVLESSRNFSGSGVINLSSEAFNGSSDVALTSSVGTFNLANLTNVATTTPTDTQVLGYNTSAGTWGPVDAGSSSSAVTTPTWYNVTVTATSANMNTTATVIWDGAYHEDSNFSLSNGVVTIAAAGTYRIYSNLVMTSTVSRASVRVQIAYNGTTVFAGQGSTGYIKSTSGHNESSVAVEDIRELAAGDTVRIRTSREAASGTVNLISNASRFIIEKIEVGTGAAAGNSSTTGKTLIASDMNTSINASGNITVPNNIGAPGDIVIVHNTTSGNISIVDGTISTMRLEGTATTGTRTLAQRGVGFLYFRTGTEVIVGGGGVS